MATRKTKRKRSSSSRGELGNVQEDGSVAVSSGKTKRKRGGGGRELGSMGAEEFMASGLLLSSSDSDPELGCHSDNAPVKKQKTRLTGQHRQELSRLAETDPEFYQFLAENDQELLDFNASEGEEEEEEEGLEEMGTPEAVPKEITSRKPEQPSQSSDDEDKTPTKSSSEGGKTPTKSSSEGGKGGDGVRMVTPAMIRRLTSKITKTHCLRSLHQLAVALHAAIAMTIQGEEEEGGVQCSAAVFNALMVACLKLLQPCLSHHISLDSKGKRHKLPSTHPSWSRVKSTVKLHLPDLLSLLDTLRDPSMQASVLKHVLSLSEYFVCFPRLLKPLNRVLVEAWSREGGGGRGGGERGVQVLAFLCLRRTILLQPHPALHGVLKKLYLAYVRNCKFTTAHSLPGVRFMQSCLVELYAIDPPTSYQHGFIYVRQLALHLRAALTSGKKDAQQSVYNWQFVHCLDLWSYVMCHVTHDSLRPLVYPLVQTIIGTIRLQPSPRFYPLRLHLTRTLLQLANSTESFIPLAPYLLEIVESHGVGVSSHVATGKPPHLPSLLKANKQQLQTRAYQTALLNECFTQLLELLATHSHTIGFPELAFPILCRLRKVGKSTQFSWLRMQLKQLVEKTEAVSSQVARERASVDFAPKDLEKIAAWERERKEGENPLTTLLAGWRKLRHHDNDPQGGSEETSSVRKKKKSTKVVEEESGDEGEMSHDGSCDEEDETDSVESHDSSEEETGSSNGDILEEFHLSSDSDDDDGA